MKTLLVILIIMFAMPFGLISAQEQPRSIEINLPDIPEEFLIDIDIPESIETEELIGILQRVFEVGQSLFSLLKNIWGSISDWIGETFGISVSEIARSLVQVIINLLEIIVDIVKQIASLIQG